MRVFITGIAGFLGSHLARRFLELGHEVAGVDSLIGGYSDNVPDEADFHVVDCRYLNTMVRQMEGADVVYHAACTAHEGLSVFSPHLITQNTFQITPTVISAAIQDRVNRFVLLSSMARYGSQNRLPFTEDMPCLPQDPYGIAKYGAEMLVRSLSEVHGMEHVICVPHNIIGPGQKYDDPYRNVASIMINMMLQGRQPIIYGDGEQKRCFSFIGDVIQCLERVATGDDVVGEIINIGPDEEFISINELAAMIADILGFDLDPVYVPERPQEVRLATCSAAKARKLLGYETKISLREGLEQLVEYIRQRGPKRFRYQYDLEIVSELTPITWRKRMF